MIGIGKEPSKHSRHFSLARSDEHLFPYIHLRLMIPSFQDGTGTKLRMDCHSMALSAAARQSNDTTSDTCWTPIASLESSDLALFMHSKPQNILLVHLLLLQLRNPEVRYLVLQRKGWFSYCNRKKLISHFKQCYKQGRKLIFMDVLIRGKSCVFMFSLPQRLLKVAGGLKTKDQKGEDEDKDTVRIFFRYTWSIFMEGLSEIHSEIAADGAGSENKALQIRVEIDMALYGYQQDQKQKKIDRGVIELLGETVQSRTEEMCEISEAVAQDCDVKKITPSFFGMRRDRNYDNLKCKALRSRIENLSQEIPANRLPLQDLISSEPTLGVVEDQDFESEYTANCFKDIEELGLKQICKVLMNKGVRTLDIDIAWCMLGVRR